MSSSWGVCGEEVPEFQSIRGISRRRFSGTGWVPLITAPRNLQTFATMKFAKIYDDSDGNGSLDAVAIHLHLRRSRSPSRLGAQIDCGLELVSARLARPKMPNAALADVLGPFGRDERVAALRARKQMRAVGFHHVRGVEHRYSSSDFCGARGRT